MQEPSETAAEAAECRREKGFAERASTRIWEELPLEDNPWIAADCRCHGYDFLELVEKRSYPEFVFLLLRGELPDAGQLQLFEALMKGLINPGPRHAAVRAAVSAGIGKTDPAHILPIGLAVLGGNHLGAGEVRDAMRFLKRHIHRNPADVAGELLAREPASEGDWHIAAGFGTRYGGIDVIPGKLAALLAGMPAAGAALAWGRQFVEILEQRGLGWLMPGVAGAALLDLGFHSRATAGLMQCAASPGILAHGLEAAVKPVTAMPFIDEEHYVIEE